MRTLITGAARRVGRGIAQELAAAGHHLVLHANTSIKERDELAETLRSGGTKVDVEQADLSDPAAVRALGERLCQGEIETVVHNASAYEGQAFEDVSEADYHNMLQVNLHAPVMLTQALLPALRRASSPNVVFIADASVDHPYSAYLPYFVSKAGLVMAMRCLALELAPDIRVNAVGPGAVLVPPNTTEAERQKMINAAPLKKIGEPKDIARAVQFVLQSPFMTGQHIRIDGGLTAR